MSVLREHPLLSALMLGCILGGGALGYALLTEDWSTARRIAAGSFAGAGVGLIVTMTRLMAGD